MSKQVTLTQDFLKGLWDQNPLLKQVLATCPTLAVTTAAMNGIAMGLATMFVLVFSSLIISLVRKMIPNQVRIAAYIVIIATFVTIVDVVMKAKFPAMSKTLGPFIPLIIVNCVILGRAEAFASKNPPLRSVLDAIGMGLGFMMMLMVLASIRELLGNRSLFGVQILPNFFEPWVVMILPAGAFFTLGLLFGLNRALQNRRKNKARDERFEQHQKPFQDEGKMLGDSTMASVTNGTEA